MRLRQRGLTREMLLEGADSLKIFESYPEDKYLPSYLVRAEREELVFHVQIATDVSAHDVRVVTMCLPAAEEWDSEFRVSRSAT